MIRSTNPKRERRAGPLLLGLSIALCAPAALAATWWTPLLDPNPAVQPPEWDWQLAVPVKLNPDTNIKIYDIEMFENEKNGTVAMLKNAGKKVVCYVDVGSWENWRDDAAQFPTSILGTTYSGFPDERWLDIRDVNPAKSQTGMALAKIISARFDRAKAMGCDAIEPDNIDGYDTTAHESTGFPLTYADQLYFNLWIAQQAHDRGMAIALKNNINQAKDPKIVSAFDFVVSEQCVQYNECGAFSEFLRLNKPVLLAEYSITVSKMCTRAKPLRISAIKKRPALNTTRSDCSTYY